MLIIILLGIVTEFKYIYDWNFYYIYSFKIEPNNICCCFLDASFERDQFTCNYLNFKQKSTMNEQNHLSKNNQKIREESISEYYILF